MIHYKQGDLLVEDVEALVNTVNCVGVMGKGLALQFKQKYPANFTSYAIACKQRKVVSGKMFVFDTYNQNPKYIINFPTKRHWKDNSRIEDIKSGLTDLIQQVRFLSIYSIAVPPLGCGNGNLKWNDVRPLIVEAFTELPEVQVIIFGNG